MGPLNHAALATLTCSLVAFQTTKANPRGATEAAGAVIVPPDPRGALPAVTDSQVREMF